MVLQGHVPIGLANLGQGEPMTRPCRQLQQLQGPLQGHGVLKGLEGGAAPPSPEAMHEPMDQGGHAQVQGGGAVRVFE